MSRSPVAFGQYIITRRIARGGMAEIYRARTRSAPDRSPRWVAVKMMRRSLGHEDLREHLFRREARIASAIHHPNVIPLYEFGQELDRHYIAMEYVRGRDVSHLLHSARKPMSLEVALYIGLQAAAGLGYAHRLRDENDEPLGIVHRDISPGNVMVGYSGEVKILDFGVARINESQGSRTQTGTLRGKFAYMSPEQTVGEALDARSDVFSLGTVLYELLTGKNAFRADNPIATLERVQALRPLPPSRATQHVPQAVDRILARCLAKDRNRRFQDCSVLHEALGEFLDKEGLEGQEALADHITSAFEQEKIEEEAELAREEEEVSIIDVVDFTFLRDDGGLDVSRIVVSHEEEASQADVAHATRALVAKEDEHDEVFDPAPGVLDPLFEPVGRKFEVSSLLAAQGGAPLPDTVRIDLPGSIVALRRPLVPSKTRPIALAGGFLGSVLLVIALVTFGVRSRTEPQGEGQERGPPARGSARERQLTTLAPVRISIPAPSPSRLPSRTPLPTPLQTPSPAPTSAARPVSIVPSSAPSPSPSPSPSPTPSPLLARTLPEASERETDSEKKRTVARRPPAQALGYLNVGARPWAEIRIDGKPWPYQTPQAGIELVVGKHTVTLHNGETGVTKTTVVQIKAGAYKTITLDMRKR